MRTGWQLFTIAFSATFYMSLAVMACVYIIILNMQMKAIRIAPVHTPMEILTS